MHAYAYWPKIKAGANALKSKTLLKLTPLFRTSTLAIPGDGDGPPSSFFNRNIIIDDTIKAIFGHGK